MYVRLKNFSDFNGKTNSVARMRSEMVGNAKYIYFDSLGLCSRSPVELRLLYFAPCAHRRPFTWLFAGLMGAAA